MLAITGPRQSGKTTLARALFGGKPYVSLENPQEREFAQTDPRRFLARFTEGAILDMLLLKGGYPALYDRTLAPNDWFPNYVATYLERDVRQLLAVHDLGQFHRFVRMCAARSGQLLNLAALGADCGISAVTAGKWLSVLETSFLAMRLPPYHRNFGKRLVKTPKLYFLDVRPGLKPGSCPNLSNSVSMPGRAQNYFSGATTSGMKSMWCWRRPKVCRPSRSNRAALLPPTGRKPRANGPVLPAQKRWRR